MDAAEYKQVVLGPIFLKYISDAPHEKFDTLKAEPHAGPEVRNGITRLQSLFCQATSNQLKPFRVACHR